MTNVAHALALGIKRIGHGTALYKNPEVIQGLIHSGATVEMCLTSNLQTGSSSSLASFPYSQLIEAGQKITINTDNRTVSNTNLSERVPTVCRTFRYN